MNTKMYVGNLPFEVTETELRDLFSAHGQVNEVAVVMDRDTFKITTEYKDPPDDLPCIECDRVTKL